MDRIASQIVKDQRKRVWARCNQKSGKN
jgi:hypothetical protein